MAAENKWSFVKYDSQNRAVISGITTIAGTAETVAAALKAHNATLSSTEQVFEEQGNDLHGYTNRCYPTNVTSSQVMNVTYYDDYQWIADTTTYGFSSADALEGMVKTENNVIGLTTGTKTKIIGIETDQWLTSVTYYDDYGNAIQTISDLYPGGTEIVSNVLDFNDQVLQTKVKQTVDNTTYEYNKWFDYDSYGRLLKIRQKITGDPQNEIVLSEFAYDDLGQLVSKKIHGNLEETTYQYDINTREIAALSPSFSYRIGYDKSLLSGVAGRTDGMISQITWGYNSTGDQKAYAFTYDKLQQYQSASFYEKSGTSWTSVSKYRETIGSYDKNGNIKTLQRYGQTAASSYGLIDNLTFTLAGNQLSRVDDAAAASAYNGGFEFKDGVKQANEYTYDSNGNLTKDLNKGISTITYNVLNLPNMVTFSDGSTIAYTYGADGTKLKTVHKTGSTTTTTDYCGNVVYENGVQKLLLTDEGYVTLSDGKYHYYLKDHQGNNRVVINQSGTVEEANHYYPFGGVFASSGNVQPYKYNGKEYDSKKGLNWYDYGARHYDAVLGRFTTNDRFAEKYYSMSPYQYGANSPVGNIDVNGDSIIIKPNANGIIDQIKVLFGYDTKFQKDVKADLFQLKQDDKKVADIIGKLEESKNIHYITMPKKGEYNSTGFNADKVKKNISQGSEIYYNPYNRRRGRNDSDMRTPRIGLAHELQHSFDVDKKVATYERTKNGILLMDIRAINTENRIRKVIGEPKRTMYGTQKVPKELLE